ncbi:MAG: glycosyltransferase family 4 protein [Bacteroidales bacterium]|nr:glycosyltransferase family 4 protein [Bacteroidales bacterium]
MKILFLPRYGKSGPSSRYRFYQYFDIIESHNIKFRVSPFFTGKYIKQFYSSGSKSFLNVIFSYLRRLIVLFTIPGYDQVVIEYELLPYFPAVFERLLKLLKINYIVDYDDAVYLKYQENKNWLVRVIFPGKIEKVIQYAGNVITGNKYLYEYAKKFNDNVHNVPTVVSRFKFDRVPAPEKKDRFILGWNGSPSSSKYLIPFSGLFRALDSNGIQINLIGFDEKLKYHFNGIDINWIEWSEDSEISEIKKFSVGIMPLEDDLWSQSKCGFKLIQYMACSLPVIASPVGINREMVDNAVTGFLASDFDEWMNAVSYLLRNPEEAMLMGQRGYTKFREKYSLESVTEQYLNIIKSSLH